MCKSVVFQPFQNPFSNLRIGWHSLSFPFHIPHTVGGSVDVLGILLVYWDDARHHAILVSASEELGCTHFRVEEKHILTNSQYVGHLKGT